MTEDRGAAGAAPTTPLPPGWKLGTQQSNPTEIGRWSFWLRGPDDSHHVSKYEYDSHDSAWEAGMAYAQGLAAPAPLGPGTLQARARTAYEAWQTEDEERTEAQLEEEGLRLQTRLQSRLSALGIAAQVPKPNPGMSPEVWVDGIRFRLHDRGRLFAGAQRSDCRHYDEVEVYGSDPTLIRRNLLVDLGRVLTEERPPCQQCAWERERDRPVAPPKPTDAEVLEQAVLRIVMPHIAEEAWLP